MTKRMQAASKLLYALPQSQLLTLSLLETALQNLKRKNLSLFYASVHPMHLFLTLNLSALCVSIRFGNDEADSLSTPLESVRFRLVYRIHPLTITKKIKS